MSVLHVIGIDPGLVHTGVVEISLDTTSLKLETNHVLINGPDAGAAAAWVYRKSEPHVFIEKYRPRSHFGTDERMVKAEAAFKQAMPKAVLLDNTGVLKVVTPELMEITGLRRFPLVSHHQDLRSAARIALLGMLRDPDMNKHLARYVQAVLDA